MKKMLLFSMMMLVGLTPVVAFGYGSATLDVAEVNGTDVVLGNWNGCSLDERGIRCWGDKRKKMSELPAFSHPTVVSPGALHACAIDDNGVKCWGEDDVHQCDAPPLAHPRELA